MNKRLNYLLGFGERYTQPIPHQPRGGEKNHAYTALQAQRRLTAQMQLAVAEIDQLPALACPEDEGVICVALHPSYLAKTQFPDEFFQRANVLPIGSRTKDVKPERWGIEKHPDVAATSEFFVAAKRAHLRRFAHEIALLNEESANDLIKIEAITSPSNLLRPLISTQDFPLLEVVLHASSTSYYILEGFRSYLNSLDVSVDLDKRIHAEGLCFLPVRAPSNLVSEIGKFSFLRVAREMPQLRIFKPSIPFLRLVGESDIELPDSEPLDSSISVAIFDGGLPSSIDLSKYVNYKEIAGLGAGVPEFEEHGLAVTSALLFGSLMRDNEPLSVPFSKVDHYRVLDVDTEHDSQQELYSVLERIRAVLTSKKYNFINLSVGPAVPIDDQDVHAWTAILDPLLAHGQTLATIAVGNGGEGDKTLRYDRIQTPADCVNGLSVGAVNRQGDGWKRAVYSSVGLGRHPGIVKPDLVDFGGSYEEPFYTLTPTGSGVTGTFGTSFAAPNTLRTAVGLQAILGKDVTSLAIRALLLHRCEQSSLEVAEVGRGRALSSLEELMTCEDDTVHVLYQGELEPAKWIRAAIPVPATQMKGLVEIKYTICFTSEVDPQDLTTYTRGGLEHYFRPHSESFRPNAKPGASAKTKALKPLYLSEQELRDDWHKWETVVSHATRVQGDNLKDPVIDIHYMIREHGRPALRAPKIPYALVVTVRKKGMKELYNQVVQRYQLLQQLRPAIEIPIRT